MVLQGNQRTGLPVISDLSLATMIAQNSIIQDFEVFSEV